MAGGKTTGDLSRYALARLLLFIQRKEFGGVLRLNGARRPINAYFLEGRPVYTDLESSSDVLGRLLVRSGAMVPEDLEACLATQKQTGNPIGREALAKGIIDQETLLKVLSVQQKRKLTKLFERDAGAFELDLEPPPAPLQHELTRLSLDPVSLVYEGISTHYDLQRLYKELQKIVGFAVKLKEGDLSTLRFLLAQEERRFVAALLRRGFWLPEDLMTASRVDEKVTLATLYTLWAADYLELEDPDSVPRLRPKASLKTPDGRDRRLTEQIAVVRPDAQVGGWGGGGGQGRPGMTVPSMPAVDTEEKSARAAARKKTQKAKVGPSVSQPREAGAPRGTGAPERADKETAKEAISRKERAKKAREALANPVNWAPLPDDATQAAKELDAELRKRLVDIEDQNLFEVMGLEPTATRKEVKDAYLVLAKKFHPDRVSSIGVEVLREPADRLFQRISEAFTTLLDDSQREEYRAIMQDSSLAGGRQKARQILEAEISFQKGEVFFRKGNYDKAEEMFQAALEGNPDEGEHLAMLAWTRYVAARKQGNHIPIAEDLKNKLMDALKLSPRCAKANYFLGKILLDQGKQDAAMPHFERAVHLDRNYVEPAREINILRMRKTRGRKPSKSSFWNRIKGK